MAWLRPIDHRFADHIFINQHIHKNYARRLIGDASEAEDPVQDAYSRIFALDGWASITKPHAFTMRIIHNSAVDNLAIVMDRATVRADGRVPCTLFRPPDQPPGSRHRFGEACAI